MAGTADTVDVWLLLEYKPAWTARALDDAEFAAGVRDWLDRSIAALAGVGLKARPQLIRQPEVDDAEVRLFIGLPGALLEFSGAGHDFLQDIDVASIVADPGRYPSVTAARYFVCTNGQRDVCCARFGLPVYAGLRDRVGRRAWQVTHLGGHRFAPNVLALPQGAVYGRVTEASLDAFVAAVEDHRLSFEHLRGRAWYTPFAQAAEALSGRSDLSLSRVEEDGAGGAVVHFASEQGSVAVALRHAEALAVQKSCGDEKSGYVTPIVPA